MDLLEVFNAEMQTEQTSGLVFRAIELGIAPFRAGKIVAYISSWEGWEQTVIFEVGKLPYLPFKITFDNIILNTMVEYRQIYADAAEAAFKFYRYRPALPVDDHIILGEE